MGGDSIKEMFRGVRACEQRTLGLERGWFNVPRAARSFIATTLGTAQERRAEGENEGHVSRLPLNHIADYQIADTAVSCV